MENQKDSPLWKAIDDVVNKWRDGVLTSLLIGGTDKPAPRSLWDRLKQGIQNWWYGPQGEKENPHRWKNRFGSELGSASPEAAKKESFDPTRFTLHEYAEIKAVVDSVETLLNESAPQFQSLKLYGIIKDAAERLKSMLFSAMKDKAPAPIAKSGKVTQPATASKTPAARVPRNKRRVSKTPPASGGNPEGAAPPASGGNLEGAAPPASGGNPGGAAPPSDPDEEDSGNEGLAGYLQDERAGARYAFDDAALKITKFFNSSRDLKKNSELKSWWLEKSDAIRKQEEPWNALWMALVASDVILDDVARITKLPKAELKRMMIDYLSREQAQESK